MEKLQLNEVKEIIKNYCVSSLGKNLIDKLNPSSDIKIVRRRLNENVEAKKILENSNHIPLEGVSNIKPIVEKVRKGMILSCEELLQVSDFLRGCSKIKKFMRDMEFYSPNLSSYSINISEFKEIEEEINFSIKNNRVDSNASKELKKIRKNIEVYDEKIREKLNKFITSSNNKKYIQEFIITKRDDRYVVPIKSSYKNEVEGAVLDTSSKGNTVFIEPKSISKYSIELISLKSEELIEEYKILSYLSEMINEKIYSINLNLDIISEYDMIFAKAKYSKSINGITPKINNKGYINIVKGKHPLLKGNVVPLDIEIGKNYRTLVITGPNAGGKTVSLKTVGILTLMVECGFDICASEETEISIFNNVFVDIGDNQSIENSLSTFSSHIKNISDIMKKSNGLNLILFDEIGSGTEPNEGAGLAISILEEFYKMGCITIASTHYGEIKRFANLHPDFENAGMLFDKETLEPLYKLVIGESQDSNALFISRKMGIKERVLKRASDYIKNKEYNLDIVEFRKNEDNLEEDIKTNETIYYVGDKVRLLDKNDFGIVYKPIDKFNNISVLYKDEFIDVNVKRVELFIRATELYPNGYDLDSLFVSFKERKLEKDIQRGSKKALRKIRKDIKNK